jgi:uncharacterized HAD superfamily protein
MDRSRKQILVDVDGTLCRNMPRLCEFLDDEYGLEISPAEITDWSFQFEEIGLGIEDVIAELFEDRPEWFLSDLDAVTGAKQALDSLSAAGHKIRIATHRPAETHDITRRWLDERDMQYDAFVHDVPRVKADLSGDVLVDDFHGHVADAVDAGMTGVLFDRPYTETVGHERAVRVSTWADAIDALGAEPSQEH